MNVFGGEKPIYRKKWETMSKVERDIVKRSPMKKTDGENAAERDLDRRAIQLKRNVEEANSLAILNSLLRS